MKFRNADCEMRIAEGARRPILIGKAEEFSTIREEIQRMIDNEGVWIATDVNLPGAEAPIVSMGGKLYAIKLDTELDPERFLSTVQLSGPFRAAEVQS